LNAPDMKNILSQLRRWISLMQQVHEAKHYIERTEQLAHPQVMQTFDELWGVLLAFRGAIISYAKCFAKAGPGKIKLEEKYVFANKPELVDQHRRIMNLRNQYVAHSDNNEMERTSIETIDTADELVIHLQYGLSFPFDRMYELRELLKHLDGHVADGLGKHVKGIERKIGKPIRIQGGNISESVPKAGDSRLT
jgi:hypothetical protein